MSWPAGSITWCDSIPFRPDVMADPNAVVRFEREVQITAALSHSNIVEIYDFGTGSVPPDGGKAPTRATASRPGCGREPCK